MSVDGVFRALRSITRAEAVGGLSSRAGSVDAWWIWGNPETMQEEVWKVFGRTSQVALRRLYDKVSKARGQSRRRRTPNP